MGTTNKCLHKLHEWGFSFCILPRWVTKEVQQRDQAFGIAHVACIVEKEMNEKPDEQRERDGDIDSAGKIWMYGLPLTAPQEVKGFKIKSEALGRVWVYF